MGTLPYYMIAAALALAAVVNPKKVPNPIAWAMAFLVLVVFVGLRHKVGMDWNNYLRMTDVIAAGDLITSFNRAEPSFAALTWLSSRFGLGVYGVNLVTAVIFVSGLFRLCRQTESPWLGLLVAYPMLIMVVACSASRQTAAIGVLLWLIAEWKTASVKKRVLFILIASMFHYSAAFMLCFVALDLNLSRKVKFLVFMLMVGATVLLMESTGGGDYYITTYVTDQTEGTYSPGAIQHILLNAIPAMFLLFGRRVREQMFPSAVLINLAMLAIVLLPIALFASLAAGRISLYLFPVSIFAFSALPATLHSPLARGITRICLGVGFVGIAIIWLNFANNSFAYIPYQNAIFLSADEFHL